MRGFTKGCSVAFGLAAAVTFGASFARAAAAPEIKQSESKRWTLTRTLEEPTARAAPEAEPIEPPEFAEPAPPVPEPEAAPSPVAPELAEKPADVEEPLVRQVITFQSNSDQLDEAGRAVLDQSADVLAAFPEGSTVMISGHADSTGPDQLNEELAERRAESVRKYLEEKGVESTQLKVEAYGASQPVAPNDSPEGRAMNRRVELRTGSTE